MSKASMMVLAMLSFGMLGCASAKVQEIKSAKAEDRSIEQIFDEMSDADDELDLSMQLETLDLDDEADPGLHPDQIRAELQVLSSTLKNKEAQLGHFQMLDDNLWKSQTEVLRGEISVLRNRKSNLETQLQQMNQ